MDNMNISSCLYIEIIPSEVGMFRFLLEAYDNIALFTVLDKYKAVLKVFYSIDQGQEVLERLQDMQSILSFQILDF